MKIILLNAKYAQKIKKVSSPTQGPIDPRPDNEKKSSKIP